MRGHVDPQSGLFSYFSLEARIPSDHPLRRIKSQVDSVLSSMSAAFDALYAHGGRPSIAPERLLKASLLERRKLTLGLVQETQAVQPQTWARICDEHNEITVPINSKKWLWPQTSTSSASHNFR